MPEQIPLLLVSVLAICAMGWLHHRSHAQTLEAVRLIASIQEQNLATITRTTIDVVEESVKATLYPTALMESPGGGGDGRPLSIIMPGAEYGPRPVTDLDYSDPTDEFITDPRDTYMTGDLPGAAPGARPVEGVVAPKGFTLDQALAFGIGNVEG